MKKASTKPPVTISAELRAAVWAKRAAGIKQAQLASLAGLHPTTFSQVVCDLVPLQADDPRVLKIAAICDVPAERAFTRERER
jgi:hypothetical protein